MIDEDAEIADNSHLSNPKYATLPHIGQDYLQNHRKGCPSMEIS